MNGHDLLKALQKLKPAQLELDIYLYLGNSEDGEFLREIKILDSSKEPYHKGDGPWQSEDAAEDEKLLFLRG